VFGRLLPRETSFFDFFEKHAALTMLGAQEFLELVTSAHHIEAKSKRIKEIEHESDVVTHNCVEALHKTFITPIERDDIHRLITRMDDIMDLIEAAAERIALYELTEMTEGAKQLADVIVRAAKALDEAVRSLRDMKHAETILQKCVEINRLENEGDVILRKATAKLFRESANDAINVIKWKEIYEYLENATDRCEDVANIIEGVVLENA
jgi:predicted phosphate transport protein (TIGR00153 family)